ncbi:MAG: HypC/HybG/HupF family hydrogenase formation chaperone [Egibacteraceae bacterium]
MSGPSPRGHALEETARPSCGVDDDGCITCGDVAVPLTVVEAGALDARCRDDDGREEVVAVELVGPVGAGDRVLVHAGVALERLTPHVAAGPAPTQSSEAVL